MKHPGETDTSEEPAVIRLQIEEQPKTAVKSEDQNAVNRAKIRSQRNPKIGCIRYNVATVTANAKLAYFSAHQPYPKRMSQLMAKHVHHHRFGQPDKRD